MAAINITTEPGILSGITPSAQDHHGDAAIIDWRLRAETQIIVYAGAVMVLFVFIIALLSPGAEERVRPLELRMLFGGVLAAVFTVDAVALLVDGGRCDGVPSTVVDCTVAPPACLREGGVPWSWVEASLR